MITKVLGFQSLILQLAQIFKPNGCKHSISNYGRFFKVHYGFMPLCSPELMPLNVTPQLEKYSVLKTFTFNPVTDPTIRPHFARMVCVVGDVMGPRLEYYDRMGSEWCMESKGISL